MNEIQIQAQINALVEQRNTALNAWVNLTGEMAVARAKIADMEKQLEFASALVSDTATTQEQPNG